MAAIIAIAAVTIFLAGGLAGALALVSIAIHREERRPRLSREAPDRITAAGRHVTRLGIRRPTDLRRTREDEMAGRATRPRRSPWA